MLRQRQIGISLVEVMVTVAIIGIIATVALPSYQERLEKDRLKAATEELASVLKLARSEARKQSSDIVFNTTNGNSGDWCYGYDSFACDAETSGAKHPTTNLTQGGTVIFEWRRGTVSSAVSTFQLTTDNFSSQVNITQSGRISTTLP